MATPSIATLLQDVRGRSEHMYAIVQAVRAEVQRVVQPLSEEVKYGGILFSSGALFGGVFAYQTHVSVEFSHGAGMEDPFKRLEGQGKLRRHIKLASPEDIKTKQLAIYLQLAVAAAQRAA